MNHDSNTILVVGAGCFIGKTLLDKLSQTGRKIIAVGRHKPQICRDASEGALLRPKSYYGAGKAAAEHFITAWSHQFNRSSVTFRPCNINGTGQAVRNGFGIIPKAFEKLIQNKPLAIWGDGETIRDFLNIDDFISLCIKVLEKPVCPGTRILNASIGDGTRINYLLELIEEISGKTFERIYERARTVDVNRIVLSNSETRQNYAWQPQYPLSKGLQKRWTWFKNLNQ